MATSLTDAEITSLRNLLAAMESGENVNTVLDLPDAGTLSAEDIFYILQGSGSNRDKKVTLGAIREFISEFTSLSVSGTGGNTSITPSKIQFNANSTVGGDDSGFQANVNNGSETYTLGVDKNGVNIDGAQLRLVEEDIHDITGSDNVLDVQNACLRALALIAVTHLQTGGTFYANGDATFNARATVKGAFQARSVAQFLDAVNFGGSNPFSCNVAANFMAAANFYGASNFVNARQTFDNAVSRGEAGRYVVPASVFGTGHKVVLIEMVNDVTFIVQSSRQIVDIKDVPATMGRRILVVNHALNNGEYNTIVLANDNTVISVLSPGTRVWLIADGSGWSVDNYAL